MVVEVEIDLPWNTCVTFIMVIYYSNEKLIQQYDLLYAWIKSRLFCDGVIAVYYIVLSAAWRTKVLLKYYSPGCNYVAKHTNMFPIL